MKQRIITGTIFALLMILIIVMSGTLVFPVVFTIISIVGTLEMLTCIGTVKNPYITVPSLIYAVVCPVIAYNFRYGMLFAATLIFMFWLMISMVFANGKLKTDSVCISITMVTYVAVCFSSLIRLRYVTTGSGVDTGTSIGQYFYLLVFIAAWVTDTFAYFTGFFFGKHKLCPTISPKKTIEGSIGGTVFCVIAFVVYGAVMSHFFKGITPNYIGLAIVGCAMSVLSQIGDLLASVIKRTYGVKDYGNLFPGHGGILDRFDSVLLLSPFLLVLVEDENFPGLLFKITEAAVK